MACVASLQQKRCASESHRLKFSYENADRIASCQQRGGWLHNLSDHFHLAGWSDLRPQGLNRREWT
jgi:hypothetical protein